MWQAFPVCTDIGQQKCTKTKSFSGGGWGLVPAQGKKFSPGRHRMSFIYLHGRFKLAALLLMPFPAFTTLRSRGSRVQGQLSTSCSTCRACPNPSLRRGWDGIEPCHRVTAARRPRFSEKSATKTLKPKAQPLTRIGMQRGGWASEAWAPASFSLARATTFE